MNPGCAPSSQIAIHLHGRYRSWHHSAPAPVAGKPSLAVWVTGHAWMGDRLLDDASMALDVTRQIEEHDGQPGPWFREYIESLNGCFAVVVRHDETLFAAVDRLRSIPLFYGWQGDRFCLSDTAEEIRSFTGATSFDNLSLKEFLLVGYVTGSETLYCAVRQLQAAEILLLEQARIQKPEFIRYYRFLPANTGNPDESALREEFIATWRNCIERVLRSIGSSRIVIPLSGGLDSRLIAATLKLLGFDNVLCFSYGRRGNWEARISRQAAEKLGYEWHGVQYTYRDFYQWSRSKPFQDYFLFSGALASRPHHQEWPAVRELKKAGIIRDDDVIVPGHSGDFVAGSHIPDILVQSPSPTIDDVARKILAGNYLAWNWDRDKDGLRDALLERIRDRLGDLQVTSPEEAVRAFECWDYQERQAKYIVNSVRVNEFCGLDWRLPFFDNELMAFWCRVPLTFRIRKRFYDEYLENELLPRFSINNIYRNEVCARRRENRSRMFERLAAIEEFTTVRWYQLTRAEQSIYTPGIRWDTWRLYTQMLGQGIRSSIYISHELPLGSYFYLKLVDPEIRQHTPHFVT